MSIVTISEMTILYLASAAQIHTVRWLNSVAERVKAVHLISLHDPSEPLHPGVICHRAPIAAPFGYIANAPWARRIIAAVQPDIVHAHYASGYGTLAGLAGFHPTVLSAWGSDVYDFPSQARWKERILRHNLAAADVLLSTSETMAAQMKRFTQKEVRITPFGVNTGRFCHDSGNGRSNAPLIIGTVKRLEAKYGIEYLIRAFAIVRERRPEIPMTLLIVGGGSLEGHLKATAQSLNISRVTTFVGAVPHALVPDYLKAMDVYVALSVLESESFGVAILEASACEVPVVVSSVGGLTEVVEDGVTGFIVPSRDPVKAADVLEILVSDGALRRRMGAAGRNRVCRQYAWDDCVDQMLKIYECTSSARGLLSTG